MARFTVSGRTSAVPTAARGPSLYNIASGCSPKVVEIGIFNTTTTAAAYSVNLATATGTQGAGLTEVKHNGNGPAADATGFNTHTVDATVANEVCRTSLGAAIGSGMVWTFGNGGLVIPAGTANGVVICTPTGTGQHIDFYIVWDE